jgi:hypothetical protein
MPLITHLNAIWKPITATIELFHSSIAGTGFSILTMWSHPSAMISASTLDELNDFVDEWLSNTSCVANSPMRSAAAYGVFAAKLTAEMITMKCAPFMALRAKPCPSTRERSPP